ncbi:hypothetical protein CRG98_006483, partial [Punica granatum]
MGRIGPNGPDWAEWTVGLLDAAGLGRTLTGCRCWIGPDWAELGRRELGRLSDWTWPEQVWTGKKVSYKHIRIFGCRAFVHIPRDERSKLDAKAKQCIFLGYAHEEFGYRFWDPDNKKIIRSRDVVFLEDQTIEDLQKLEKAKVSSPHEISIPVPVDVEHPVEE